MKRSLIIIIAIALLGCQTGPGPIATTPNHTDALFVEQVLRLEFAEAVSQDIPLVIDQELSIFSKAGVIASATRLGKDYAEAARDLLRKNKGSNTLDSIGTIPLRHSVLTEQEVKTLFQTEGKDGWKAFYMIYAESPGIITLSRPGFSKDGTVAMIYLGNQSNWLAGRGGIRVYEKRNGKWTGAGSIGRGYVS
ncbi:MAG: hypothetical protein GXY07_16265 [Candidatus Hydrogenedentes bacterium]|nr:hypothetical protein [Candidatus Hydrogenedentota bacterium]